MPLPALTPDEYNKFYVTMQFILKWEGGYSNDPQDPGGETKWGISKRYHQDLDIKNLTPEQATEIYYKEYWTPSGASNSAFPMCVVVMDTCVNMGVGQAKIAKKAGGDVNLYISLRRDGYVERVKKSPVKQKYLKGWLNRLSDLEKYIQVTAV